MSSIKKTYFPCAGHNGHTLIAAILDSHPNVAIANEYEDLDKDAILSQARNRDNWMRGTTYTFPLPGQGKWEDLKVIGTTGRVLSLDLEEVPIVVIRNPFDVISSRFRKTSRRYTGPRDPMDVTIEQWYKEFSITGPFVFYEDFVANPRKDIRYLMGLLGLDWTENWLKAATDLVSPAPISSFNKSYWNPNQLQLVKNICLSNKFLRAYGYK